MYQNIKNNLKLAIDRKFDSIRDVLDYIDNNFCIMNLDDTSLESLEQLIRELKPNEKKEVLENIIRIRLRRITSKL
jgi:hypothetical protein